MKDFFQNLNETRAVEPSLSQAEKTCERDIISTFFHETFISTTIAHMESATLGSLIFSRENQRRAVSPQVRCFTVATICV